MGILTDSLWFVLLIISIIFLIVGIILFEVYNKNTATPWWIWLILGIGLFLFFVAVIAYYVYSVTNVTVVQRITNKSNKVHIEQEIKTPRKIPSNLVNVKLADDM